MLDRSHVVARLDVIPIEATLINNRMAKPMPSVRRCANAADFMASLVRSSPLGGRHGRHSWSATMALRRSDNSVSK
jgi:hypothetical protein